MGSFLFPDMLSISPCVNMKACLTDGKKRGSMTMNEIKEISPLKPPDQTNKFLSFRSRALWFFKKLSPYSKRVELCNRFRQFKRLTTPMPSKDT